MDIVEVEAGENENQISNVHVPEYILILQPSVLFITKLKQQSPCKDMKKSAILSRPPVKSDPNPRDHIMAFWNDLPSKAKHGDALSLPVSNHFEEEHD
jgi:hypothetical protein